MTFQRKPATVYKLANITHKSTESVLLLPDQTDFILEFLTRELLFNTMLREGVVEKKVYLI